MRGRGIAGLEAFFEGAPEILSFQRYDSNCTTEIFYEKPLE